MLEIKRENTYRMKTTASVRNILGETFFILDSDTGKQYNLTEMEYEIVELISKGATFGKIVDQIVEEYSAPSEQIEEDLREYYASLLAEGIIIE